MAHAGGNSWDVAMAAGPTHPALATPSLIRTPDQRLRVFVSSTLEELATERAAARAAIESLRLTPVMFELGARPHPPRDLYRAYLEQSHVFVGIYWQRYGWVAPGETVSGLEDEYRLSGARPKLIYLKDSATETEPRLGELIGRIRSDDTASYRRFSTPDELEALVKDDLAILLTERFEQPVRGSAGRLPGWAHTNLPVPRNPLIGREVELAATCDRLREDGASLVTLIGPGGCGKSRLALEAALELLGVFEDGVYLVPLESVRDPELVPRAIIEALKVKITADAPLDGLADLIGQRHLLLLLDNFEQVIEAGPDVSALLERCPRLVILATSRTPIRIRGERRVGIPPLALPETIRADLHRLSQYAAVALFVQRAQAIREDLTITTENAPVIAEICHRLDGLPLAIELAAARLRLLDPAEVLARLSRRFDLLRGGARDLPERHQTLRKTIDWSYDLLGDDARRAFRRLSAFAGGATLEAAEAVTALDGQPGEQLDLIASLVDDSMLTSSVGEQGDLRIGMLDSIREYASEKLVASGELDRIRRAHAVWFLSLAERAEPHLVSRDEATWAARLHDERPNIRAAMDWCITHDRETGLRIGASAWRFWESHGSIAEGFGWLERLLATAPTSGHADASREAQVQAADEVRARALHAASALGCYLGQFGVAHEHIREALEISERTGDQVGVARALNEAGALAYSQGAIAEARDHLERALAIRREIGEPWAIASALTNLGLVAGYEGDLGTARTLHRESVVLFRQLGERLGVAIGTGNLAHVAKLEGKLDEALTGQIESLRLFREIGDLDGTAESVERLAMVANAVADHRRAARLFGIASAVREQAGTAPAALERAEADRELCLTRDHLDPGTFESELQEGRAMSIDDALALCTALAVGGAPAGPG